MADDWRVTATLHDPDFVDRLLQRLRRHELEEDVVERLGGRVAVTTGPTHVFVYADSEGAARQAERVVRDVCAAHGFEAEVTVDRWHPAEERWEDARIPLPQTESERRREHERLREQETEQSQRTGLAEWEIRVELDSHDDATTLADKLTAEGMTPVRRWKYLVVGANNEDEAKELAEHVRSEAPPGSAVSVEAGPAMAREGTAGTRFAAWFD
jgi:hypothetical protein